VTALAHEEQTKNYGKLSAVQLIAAVVFLFLALWLTSKAPTAEIAWVIGFLMLTIYLLAFEGVGVDVAALCISCVGGSADGLDYVYCSPNLRVRIDVARCLRRRWKAFHRYRTGRMMAALLAPTTWHPLLERRQVPI